MAKNNSNLFKTACFIIFKEVEEKNYIKVIYFKKKLSILLSLYMWK